MNFQIGAFVRLAEVTLMVSSNRDPIGKQNLSSPCAGFRVVFAVGTGRRMLGLRRTEPSYVDGALGQEPMHPIRRNGSAHVPAGTELQADAG
jgi:hypothetical protein